MIIKFDHIAYACSMDEIDDTIHQFSDYQLQFRDTIVNLDVKAKNMYNFENKHELIMLLPFSDDGDWTIPIEITAYSTVNHSSNYIFLDNDVITIFSSEPSKTKSLLKYLGFVDNEGMMIYKSIFNPKKVMVNITYDPTIPRKWYFDTRGFGCLAFVSNSAEKERNKLISHYTCSDLYCLNVNNQLLRLFFVYGDCGELIEIYSIEKSN